jgi:hypothetical protein
MKLFVSTLKKAAKNKSKHFTKVGGLTCRWQRQLIKRRFYHEVNCLNPEEGMEKKSKHLKKGSMCRILVGSVRAPKSRIWGA